MDHVKAHIRLWLSDGSESLKILLETEEKDLPKVCKEKFIHLQPRNYRQKKMEVSIEFDKNNSEWKQYKIHALIKGLNRNYFVKKVGV